MRLVQQAVVYARDTSLPCGFLDACSLHWSLSGRAESPREHPPCADLASGESVRPVGAVDPRGAGPKWRAPDQEQQDDAHGGAASGGSDTATSGPFLPEASWPRLRGVRAGVRGRACLSRLPVMAEGLSLGGGHAPHTPVPGSLQPHRLAATWGPPRRTGRASGGLPERLRATRQRALQPECVSNSATGT